jgi:hypothetical protein
MLPLVDELIGKFQFDRLCDEAKNPKIFASIPVGEELYFPDGRWRISSSPPLEMDENNRVQAVYKSLVRYESNDWQVTGAAIRIRGSDTRLFNRKTGQLLASYRMYYTRGGWLSRWGFEKPSLVRDQCLAQTDDSFYKRMLPFEKRGGHK